MDPDLLLIFCFIIVVTAVIGVSVNGIVKKALDYKRSVNAPALPEKNAKVAEIEERTQAIEDRLRVLERIATDPEARRGAELAQEIEQLRIEQKEDAQ
ncbi:MAG: hypothetical protein AAFW59_08025 [Pseudomonadota bacterium]